MNNKNTHAHLSIFFGVIPIAVFVVLLTRLTGTMPVDDPVFNFSLYLPLKIFLWVAPPIGVWCFYNSKRKKEKLKSIRVMGLILNILSAATIYGTVLFAAIVDYLNR